jgi:hypothetical protein
MAGQVLKTTGIWMDGYDLSGQLRGVNLQRTAELKDATTFGNSTRIMFPTVKNSRFSVEGLWSAAGTDGAPEKPIFTNIGLEGSIVSIAPVRTEGTPAFTFQVAQGTYTFGGQFGDIMPFSMGGDVSTAPGLVRGQLIFDKSALSSSGNGTKFQVGAVAAGQRMYAALHVINAGTGTFDGILQSDADSSAGSESTRITFTQATGVSSQWSSVAGAVTDTWWRLNYTIAGGAPSFTAALIIGVL